MLELFRDNLVQLIVFAVVAGFVLHFLGFIKLRGANDVVSMQPEYSESFANPVPESEYLMVERGGRKDWREEALGTTGSGLGEGVQAPIDKSLGQANALTGPAVPQLFTSTGEHLIRVEECDQYL